MRRRSFFGSLAVLVMPAVAVATPQARLATDLVPRPWDRVTDPGHCHPIWDYSDGGGHNLDRYYAMQAHYAPKA